MTHICVGNITLIGSDNGLSPGRRQVIIWTNAGILLIGPLGTNFSEILIKIITFSFKKMCSKMSSGKRRSSCLGLNVLTGPKFGPHCACTCPNTCQCQQVISLCNAEYKFRRDFHFKISRALNNFEHILLYRSISKGCRDFFEIPWHFKS